ncbi:MAG TPA: hypothetical protein VN796_09865 [Acidimicrobiales bacterium]|nr:hypothetical protein [Acidimicrobiales bacterium]
MFDTAYVSKKIPLCPVEAAAVTDLWHRSLNETSIGSRYVRGTRYLWMGRELSSSGPEGSALRHTPGVLFVLGRPVRIEFELTEWSATETTVAIRPRAGASIIRTERYASAALRALDGVAEALAWAQASARTPVPVRSVSDALLERKLQWPARTERDIYPFPVSPRAVPLYAVDAGPAFTGMEA